MRGASAMALPNDNADAKTDAVAAEIKKMGPKDLAALPDLEAEDLQLFGTLIQYFAFMDLNLRRALESFHGLRMLPKEYVKLWPKSIPDSKLTEALATIIKGMDPKKEDIKTALVWIEVINVTRRQRNLVGHFAGKRHPKADVYVFASKSEKDAIKVLGTGLGQHEVHTVVAGRSEFAEMVQSAMNAHEWLAAKVPEWNGRYLNS
jgi:hypothetical protein